MKLLFGLVLMAGCALVAEDPRGSGQDDEVQVGTAESALTSLERNAAVIAHVRTHNRIVPLVGAEVSLQGSLYAGTRTTDGGGFVGFGIIPAGTYDLRIYKPGLTDFRRSGVIFAPGDVNALTLLVRGADAPAHWAELFPTLEHCRQAHPAWDCRETHARGRLEYYRTSYEGMISVTPTIQVPSAAPKETVHSVSPASRPPYAAAYVSQSMARTLTVGDSTVVSVTMKNTGTLTWSEAAAFRLGSQSPQDNYTWSKARVSLPSGVQVAPGQSFTFSFEIRAPYGAGSYPFRWQMVRDGVTWFGEPTPEIAVQVSHDNRSIRFASSSPMPDFDGDHFADFADHLKPTGGFWIHRNTRAGGASAFSTANWGYADAADAPWKVLFGDFTGDGKADYADYHPDWGTFWVHQNLGNGTFSTADWTWAHVGSSPDEEAVVGDFNGDRYADILKRNTVTGALTIWLNMTGTNGSRTFTQVSGCCAFRTMTGSSWRILVGDFNGDGRDDVADLDSNTATLWIHLNNGAPSYDFSKADYAVVRGTKLSNHTFKIVSGDFTGDGRDDYAEILSSTGEMWIHANRGNGQFDGFGVNWGYARTYRPDSNWSLAGE